MIRCLRCAVKNVFFKNTDLQMKSQPRFLVTTVSNQTAPKLNPTVDKADVDFHEQYMKSWWAPNGSHKALHAFNMIRIPFICDNLSQSSSERDASLPLKNKKILEVGCGGGILTEGLANLGAEMTGIDASKILIDVASEHSAANPKLKNKPTYYDITVEEHSVKFENYYDAVVSSEVIEHVNEKDLFVNSCVRALKPGGQIFFTTPSKTRISQLFVILIAENIFNSPPKGTHQYDKFISHEDLGRLLEKYNCQVAEVKGVFYNMATNKWSWSRSKSFFYALRAIKNN